MQTRRFGTKDEEKLQRAAAQVLRDLGFQIDDSETKLGVIVASKSRDARETGQIVGAVVVAIVFGVAMPTDKNQKIRASLVTKQVDNGADTIVRITLQRTVWNTRNEISKNEGINDPRIYQEFFEKLSQSVFLTAQEILIMQRVLAAFAMLLLLSACMTDSKEQILATNQSAVQLRSFQTRAFDTTDRVKTLKTVISTLQDLNFVLDKADALLGTVTATKLDRYALRMTVTVRERGTTQTLVRANAQYQVIAVEDPKPYQQFFEALQKAMFLTAHEVDG